MGSKRLISGLICLVALAWATPAFAQEMETAQEMEPVDEGEPEQEIGVDYYTPEYYQESPVFYDEAGMPIYYRGGVRYYVPRTYVHFNGLLGHYRAHRYNYNRWYNARGRRYHGYRRVVRVGGDFSPLYHDGYAVFYTDAGVPYYYQGNRMVYVPSHHPRYNAYRTHYTAYRPRYRTWYRQHGTRFRGRVAPAAYGRPAPAAYGRPYRAAPPAVNRPAPYGRPVRAQPGYGGGAVDCRSNPGHPACRRGGGRGGVQYGPGPAAPHDRGRGRGRRSH